MILKYLIQTSIFRYSKNYGSLTHETRIKDAVNMGDLICLLATVRTLNIMLYSSSKELSTFNRTVNYYKLCNYQTHIISVDFDLTKQCTICAHH